MEKGNNQENSMVAARGSKDTEEKTRIMIKETLPNLKL